MADHEGKTVLTRRQKHKQNITKQTRTHFDVHRQGTHMEHNKPNPRRENDMLHLSRTPLVKCGLKGHGPKREWTRFAKRNRQNERSSPL